MHPSWNFINWWQSFSCSIHYSYMGTWHLYTWISDKDLGLTHVVLTIHTHTHTHTHTHIYIHTHTHTHTGSDVIMVVHIHDCYQIDYDVSGYALPFWHQYTSCTDSVGSNHYFQTIGTYRDSSGLVWHLCQIWHSRLHRYYKYLVVNGNALEFLHTYLQNHNILLFFVIYECEISCMVSPKGSIQGTCLVAIYALSTELSKL